MVLSKVSFVGTKYFHKKFVSLELHEEESNRWRVLMVCDEKPMATCRVIYDGKDRGEAETALVNGFQFHFAEEYMLDGADEMTKDHVFEMFDRAVEAMYLRILSGLGYNVNGRWHVKSFFKGKEPKVIDEIGILLVREKK